MTDKTVKCTLKTSYREIIDEIFLIFKNNLFKTSENNKPKVETKVFISSNKQSISKEVETKKDIIEIEKEHRPKSYDEIAIYMDGKLITDK